MTALYLDSSAFLKTVVNEPGSTALKQLLGGSEIRPVSSALLRAEALRGVRRLGPEALHAVREGLALTDLIAIDDRILEAAGTLEPRILRTLDAIHLVTAMAAVDDLDGIVTYDARMIDAARVLGLPTISPA